MSELRLVVCGKLGESRSRMGRIGEGWGASTGGARRGDLSTHGFTLSLEKKSKKILFFSNKEISDWARPPAPLSEFF